MRHTVFVDQEAHVEAVLCVVEQIPPGRVMSYGDVAAWVEAGGPRQVGALMAQYGGAVPWWRVVRADGSLPRSHDSRAREHYWAEGTPMRSGRVVMRDARWNPAHASA